MFDKLINSDRYKSLLLDTPIECKCGEPIKFKHQTRCLECSREETLMADLRESVKVINEGTNYEGIDWSNLMQSSNATSVRAIKKQIQDSSYNVLIYGNAKGVGKSTTAHIIKHYEQVKGKHVIYGSMVDIQNKLKSDTVDPYSLSEKIKSCDLFILDEIGRGVSDSTYYGDKLFYRSFWYEIIDKRIDMRKSTVLIGNVNGLMRDGQDGQHYCDDFFDKDRLKYYTAYEFTGQSHRGYRA